MVQPGVRGVCLSHIPRPSPCCKLLWLVTSESRFGQPFGRPLNISHLSSDPRSCLRLLISCPQPAGSLQALRPPWDGRSGAEPLPGRWHALRRKVPVGRGLWFGAVGRPGGTLALGTWLGLDNLGLLSIGGRPCIAFAAVPLLVLLVLLLLIGNAHVQVQPQSCSTTAGQL